MNTYFKSNPNKRAKTHNPQWTNGAIETRCKPGKFAKNQAQLLKNICDVLNARNGGGYAVQGGRVVRLEVSQ